MNWLNSSLLDPNILLILRRYISVVFGVELKVQNIARESKKLFLKEISFNIPPVNGYYFSQVM
jgi:hypothetical protein